MVDSASAARILGVQRHDPPEVIRRAWRRAAAQHHPDRGGDRDAFEQVRVAYELLSQRTTAWPDARDLPEGTLGLTVDGVEGILWTALVSDGATVEILDMFSVPERGGWAAMLVEGPAAVPAGAWLSGTPSPFGVCSALASTWVAGDRWTFAAPRPAADAPVDLWLWHAYTTAYDRLGREPMREQAMAVARQIAGLIERAPDDGREVVVTEGARLVARAVA